MKTSLLAVPDEVRQPGPMAIAEHDELSADERRYIVAVRAANTSAATAPTGTEFATWCTEQGVTPLPAAPRTVSGYLTLLAGHGSKVGTMSRRLSAIRFVHNLQNRPDPTANALVVSVWEGIRRRHSADPDQARPLMPPQLWDVLATLPTQRSGKTRGRPLSRILPVPGQVADEGGDHRAQASPRPDGHQDVEDALGDKCPGDCAYRWPTPRPSPFRRWWQIHKDRVRILIMSAMACIQMVVSGIHPAGACRPIPWSGGTPCKGVV